MLSNSTTNNNMVKSKSSRKSNNKKKTNNNMIHPHIELIQAEISTLTDEIKHIEDLQRERELDATEQHQKDIAAACLEKYQTTLAKMNDASTTSKLRSYQGAYNTRKNEAQILFLLQFFYIVRLGQLGLFDVIGIEASPKTMLNAITDICDQLIGASVYHATEPSPTIKMQKRKQVADILKKLDTNSEDVILENVTFKDIKNLIQHIWDNTVSEAQVLENAVIDESAAKEWAVIQFENMVQNGEITPEVDSKHNDMVEQQSASESKAEEAQEAVVQETKEESTQQEPEPPSSNETAGQQPSVENQPSAAADELNAKDSNKTSTVSEWDKTEDPETPAVDDWNSKDANVASSTSAWEKKKKLEKPATSKEWTDTSNHRKSSKSSTKPNWKSSNKYSAESKGPENWSVNESRGWNNVVDNPVKADAWDNAESSATNNNADKNWVSSPSPPPAATEDKQEQPSDNWTSTPDEQQEKPTETDVQQQPQQANTPPASPKLVNTKDQQQEPYNSETNDNWRRRGIEDINNSRGRGSSYRGGHRSSNRGGKFRGGSSGGGRGRGVGGSFRGRGRGRGRGADFDGEESHHSNPSQ